MGIEKVIRRQYKQKAVYWGTPNEDGYGGKIFAEPIEINCRWEEMEQLVTDAKGNTITCRALVFVDCDVDEEGYLYLGTLESLYDDYASESSASRIENPMSIDGAWSIKRFQKTPSLDGKEYLRKAYLTPSLSFGGF
jgi:hypothetical protein